MKKIILVIFCIKTVSLFSQVPFSTYKRPTLESHKTKNFGAFINPSLNKDSLNRAFVSEVNEEIREQTLDKTDFFEHASANLISIQNGKKLFPSINGEVINYKLSVWTSTKNDGTIRPHYIPLSIISKISGNYIDSSAGATNDATSFFGAPITFRLSPSFELTGESDTENKLFVGVNADLRLLMIGDTQQNKLNTGWGGYGSIGVTYMGKGYASQADDGSGESERFEGKWSFSALLFFFKSGGAFNKAVFGDYETKTLSGIELLLRFKANKKEDSKFNFLIGASNGFTRGAPNFAKWEFRIGIGK